MRKREQFRDEREVRGLRWIRDEYAGINRHFDEDNFPHDHPLTPPDPGRVPVGNRRSVDLAALLTEIVLGLWTSTETRASVQRALSETRHDVAIRDSDLARHVDLLPTAREVRQSME